MSHAEQTRGSIFGMWLFLYSEIMLFGGLFVLYAAYYHRYFEDFVHGGRELSLFYGATNTVILLASSLAMVADKTDELFSRLARGMSDFTAASMAMATAMACSSFRPMSTMARVTS